MIGKCDRCDTYTQLEPGTSLCPSCAKDIRKEAR